MTKKNNPTSRKLVDERYARTGFYKKVIGEAKREKECPLCSMRWHTNPTLKTIGGWFITKSFQPYENSNLHFLIISKQHKERFEKLKMQDWKEIFALEKWAIKKYH